MVPTRCTAKLIFRAATICAVAAAACRAYEMIAVTEILKDPLGGESAVPGGKSHEFVEFTNLGNTPFPLDSLFLSNGDKVDSVERWAAPLAAHPRCAYAAAALAPGLTAVILDRDYRDAPLSSAFLIDSSALLLTVDHVSIADGLSADEGVFLYKGTRTRIDRVVASACDPGQICSLSGTVLAHSAVPQLAEGVSAVPARLLLSPSVWIACPGTLSAGTYEFLTDCWLAEWNVIGPDTSGGSAVCSLACLRVCDPSPSPAAWTVSVSGGPALVAPTPLPSSDGPARMAATLQLDTVQYRFCVESGPQSVCRDVDISAVWAPLSALKITEVFPRSDGALPEWFEITNISAMAIDVAGWRYGNSEAADTLTLADRSIAPGRFLVVAADAAALVAAYPYLADHVLEPPHWHALDNYSDTLRLWTRWGAAAETVAWSSAWFDSWDHESIERVSTSRAGTDRAAWALALRATPGQPNASATWRQSASPAIDIGPIPFTPDGDGVDDVLSVSLRLPASSSARITVYGFNGDTFYEFPQPLPPQMFWDGRRSDGSRAPVGPFFVVAEFRDPAGRIRTKGVLWR